MQSPEAAPSLIRIGPLEISPEARVISLGEEKIHLPWRCFEALLVLAEADTQVVERDVFFRRLWPDVSVEETSLNQAIARLRRELRDAGDLIETVPRRGYRLAVRPEKIGASARPADLPTPTIPPQGRRRSLIIAVAAISVACVAVALIWPRWSRHRQAMALVEDGFRLVHGNRTPDVEEAKSKFTRALEVDSKLAIGYAGLAEAMARSVDGSRIHAGEMADRSLALDPKCADCLGIAGWIQLTYQWRFREAVQHLQMAARERPADAKIQLWNAQALSCAGRLEEALREIEHAVALRPTDAATQSMKAGILYLLGRYSDSIATGRLALGLSPGYTGALDWIYRSGMAAGRVEEALSARGALMASFGGMSPEWRDQQERSWNAAYQAGGIPRLVEQLLANTATGLARKGQCYDRASLRAWAGDGPGAIAELENIFEVHPYHSIYLGVDPIFASFRNDAKFRAILGRIGLDQILVARN